MKIIQIISVVCVKSQRRDITSLVKKAYELYFGWQIGDQGKSWAPHICCASCVTLLSGWLNGKSRRMPFAVQLYEENHSTDCYFCIKNITEIPSKTKKTIKFPNLPSAIRPVPHSNEPSAT